MNLIQVVPTLETEASGPAYSVPRLAGALARRGHQVTLMTAGGQAIASPPGVDVQRFPRNLGHTPIVRTLELSAGLHRALMAQAPHADLIHANGLWTGPTLYPAWAARRARVPLIVSPRGTLSPVALERSPLRKRMFWALAQGPAVLSAKALHATSEQEYLDIRSFGLRAPVAVIPNGIDVAPVGVKPVGGARHRLLYLGRLHPIKGLDLLLKAWAEVAPTAENWELRLVGPGPEDYRQALLALVADRRIPRVQFGEPRYGADKATEYERSDLFVLPSHSENFGMTIAEALAQSVPVITTTGAPWAGVVENACGWHVTPDVTGLKGALTDALAKDRVELRRMGEAGRAWMQRDYSWEGIAQQIEAVYHWARRGGPAPATIRLD